MEEILTKLLLVLLGLYAGLWGFLLKMAWGKIENNAEDIKDLQLNCPKCQSETTESFKEHLDARFKELSGMIEEKFDNLITKVELNWINEGRLPAKKTKKDNNG